MVADGFEPVRAAFADNFARRGERGAAVAVYHEGRRVVDLWAGSRDADGDPAPGRVAWSRDTAQVVRSVTKGVTAAAPLLLHQRGQLDLDAPVATYWPEFRANGKSRVLVRHLLSHRAGVPVLDTPLTPAQAIDGVSGPRAVAAQAPAWPAGEAHGYHAQTYSWLLAELVLRVTGRTIGRWFADELAAHLPGPDADQPALWIGLPASQRHRVGRLGDLPEWREPPSAGPRRRPKQAIVDAYTDPSSLTRRAFAAITPAPDENDDGYRAAELPASGGVATAEALARFYATLIGPVPDPVGDDRQPPTGVRAAPPARARPTDDPCPPSAALVRQRAARPYGHRPGASHRGLFAPATLTMARTEESAGPDRVLVVGSRFGLGYMLHGPAAPMLGAGSFGHPGRGGSLAFADPESGVGFGYVTNGMRRSVTADARAQALLHALRGCLRPADVPAPRPV